MSPAVFQFLPSESFSASVRRIVGGLIDEASGILDGPEPISEETIHTSRKNFKKIRAIIRLARADAPPFYKRENGVFRNAGRMLSPLRDADAMLEALGLLETVDRDVPPEGIARLREVLFTARNDLRSRNHEHEAMAGNLVEILKDARSRLTDWPLSSDGEKVLARGVARAYRRGRRARRRAVKKPTDKRVHTWRKRAKDLWYQSRLLAMSYPDPLGLWEHDLDLLAKALGEFNDLAMLRRILLDDRNSVVRETGGGVDQQGGMQRSLNRRAAELLKEAKATAIRVYGAVEVAEEINSRSILPLRPGTPGARTV